jgi:gas vesicle protein
MDKLIYFLVGAVIILIFWLLRMSIKLRTFKSDVEKFHQEIEKLRNNTEILKNRVNQSQGADLDLSTLENQVEENTQQLVDYIQDGISRANRDIGDLEERVYSLEKEQNEESEKLMEIEEKIEDVEEENK